jgi:hypothetical protein
MKKATRYYQSSYQGASLRLAGGMLATLLVLLLALPMAMQARRQPLRVQKGHSLGLPASTMST